MRDNTPKTLTMTLSKCVYASQNRMRQDVVSIASVQQLATAGAGVIAFDLLFSESEAYPSALLLCASVLTRADIEGTGRAEAARDSRKTG